MSTTATHVDDQLLDYAYGELSERDASAVKNHLAGCPKCQGALDDIQGVRKVMAKLPPSDAPNDGLDSLLAYAEQAARRVQAGPAPKKTWWRSWVLPLAGVTAAATFFIVANSVIKDRPLGAEVKQAAMEQAAKDRATEGAPAAPPAQAAAAPAPVVAASPVDEGAKFAKRDEAAANFGAQAQGGEAQEKGAPSDDFDSVFGGDARAAKPLAGKQKPAADKDVAALHGDVSGADLAKRASKNEESRRTSSDGVADSAPAVGGLGGLGAAGSGLAQGAGGGLGYRGAAPGGGGKGSVTSGGGVDLPAAQPEPKAEKKKRAKAEAYEPLPDPDADARAEENERARGDDKPAAPPPPPKSASTGRAASTPAMVPSAAAPSTAAALDDADLERAQTEAPAEVASAKEVSTREKTVDSNAPASDDARARTLLDQALAANRGRRYDDAIALSRQVLALRVRDERITQGALSAMCEAQGVTADDYSACDRLVREFPSSAAAKVAKQRMELAHRTRGAGSAGTPAAAPPAAKARAAERKADEAMPADVGAKTGSTSN